MHGQWVLEKPARLSKLTVVTVDGIMENTGNISMTMPNGEACTGKWSSASPSNGCDDNHVVIYSVRIAIAGLGTMVGPAPGVSGEEFVTCAQGTSLQAEFYTGSGTANVG
jgi:hypothetical protein